MQLDSVRALKQEALALAAAPSRVALAAGASDPKLPRPVEVRQVGIGIAPSADGQFRLAVRVHRRNTWTDRVVNELRELSRGEIDLRYVGLARSAVTGRRPSLQPPRPSQPLEIGCSIAHYRASAGSLGAFVRARDGTEGIHVLSNNHVLAYVNRGNLRDDVLRPSPGDGGTYADRVAGVSGFVRLRSSSNDADCATALLDDGIPFDAATVTQVGQLRGVSPLPVEQLVGIDVAKCGRTTQTTAGRVTAFDVDIAVQYDIGTLMFRGQLEMEGADMRPFAARGDSGSLVVTRDCMAAGLVFAVTSEGGANGKGLTYANPIRTVLDLLNVELIT